MTGETSSLIRNWLENVAGKRLLVEFSSPVLLCWKSPGAFYTNDWAVIKRKDERRGHTLRRLTRVLASVASIKYQACCVVVTCNSGDAVN